jgi:UDP-glucuronate decarboxylase
MQALRGEPITVFGDGQQTRAFCYVDDLVEGMLRLMDSDDDITGPFNLGNPAEFTILDLAEEVLRQTGSSSPLVHKALPQDDPQQRQPDIARARAMLDWEPRVPLEDGLRKTIDYFRTLLRDLVVA